MVHYFTSDRSLLNLPPSRIKMATDGFAGDSDSSSASDNEDLARLKEAVNHEFIDKSLFNDEKKNKTGNESDEPPRAKLVSLRSQPEDEQFQNAVHVTPGFQKFVSKKLAKLIDSQIEEKTNIIKVRAKQEPEGGIRLLSGSKAFVDVDSIVPEPTTKRRKYNSCESSKTERERASQVAVTSDWVLNKEGTKGWELPRRGDEVLVTKSGAVIVKKKSRYSKE